MQKKTRLILEDKTVFKGTSFGAPLSVAGEVVFNTQMVGYPEALTDPSYLGQLLAITFPLVGNYGVPKMTRDEFGLPVNFESDSIKAKALIVSEVAQNYSHFEASCSLDEWLKSEGIPGISGIDTRALTKLLRERGSMLGKLEIAEEKIDFFDPNVTSLVESVSPSQPEKIIPGAGVKDIKTAPTCIVVDCGCKANILRNILKRGINVVRVPYNYYFLNMDFDGVVLSNGPGDPKLCSETVQNVERAMAFGKPIMGICLGNQILSLAAGLETYKLKFGHRSQNQPCVELPDPKNENKTGKKAVITSQNHGYAVRGEMPEDWRVWFENANDGTVEGIRHVTKPFFAVQFHPEATPGPQDTEWIFDEFARLVGKK